MKQITLSSLIVFNIIKSLFCVQVPILPASLPCRIGNSFNDPYIGEIKLDSSTYCTPEANRNIKGKSCCLPQQPGDNFPQIFIFLKEKKYSYKIDWRDANSLSKVVPNYVNRYIVLLPGMFDSIKMSNWLIPAVGVISRLGYPVIVVDWIENALSNYWQTSANVRTIGAVFGQWLIKNNLVSKVSLIGFGHGGQVIHETSKFISTRSMDRISECIALDPAGLGFDGGPLDAQLNPGDCEIVQSIHTGATIRREFYDIFGTKTFGSTVKNGNCDWWFNCGKQQSVGMCRIPTANENLAINGLPIVPGILKTTLQDTFLHQITCSNLIAPSYLLSELSNRCNFKGFPCSDCGDNIDPTKCNFDTKATPVPFLTCSPYENSSYYVYSPAFPFC